MVPFIVDGLLMAGNHTAHAGTWSGEVATRPAHPSSRRQGCDRPIGAELRGYGAWSSNASTEFLAASPLAPRSSSTTSCSIVACNLFGRP